MASDASTRPQEGQLGGRRAFIAGFPNIRSRIRRHGAFRWAKAHGLEDDLEQHTLVGLARVADRGQLPDTSHPHFSVVLKHRLFNAIRDLEREHRCLVERLHVPIVTEADGEEVGATVAEPATEDTALAGAMQHQAATALRQAAAQLAPRQHQVIELVLKDLDDAEIARELGVSVQAVNKTKRAALLNLRALVSPDYLRD